MKVHPGMLMKTNKSRYLVLDARCQGLRAMRLLTSAWCLVQEISQNEASSGYVDENK
jgi:hypothetical protein